MLILLSVALSEELPDFLQAPIDADVFQPTVQGRMMVTTDAQPDEGVGYAFQFTGQSARNPYVWIDRETGEETVVLSGFSGAVVGGASWRGNTRLGLDVPVYVTSGGPIAVGGPALGEARLHGRQVVVPGGDERVGLALTGAVRIPLGRADSLLGPNSSQGEAGLVLDYAVGRTLWALNLGGRFGAPTTLHPSLRWGSQLHFGFGTAVALTEGVDLTAEVVGHTQFNDLFGYSQGSPIQTLGSVQVEPAEGLVLRVGGGVGLTDGVGAADWRVVAGVVWAPTGYGRDRDRDTIPDEDDACPTSPEDPDGFEDDDGCPEADNDVDGVLDGQDRCPDEAEDPDGYEDDDGCPEDNAYLVIRVIDWKGEAVPATLVHVSPANEMGDVRDLEDVHTVSLDLAEGAWEVRVQAEGYADWFTTVSLDAEDETVIDARLRTLGSVARVRVTPFDREDNPMESVQVVVDGEVTVPIVNGEPSLELDEGQHTLVIKKAGHVPVETTVDVSLDEERNVRVVLLPDYVELQDDVLVLTHPIDFVDESVLTPRGEEIVDEIHDLLKAHPEITLLRIEGHTDNIGPDDANLELSQMRADTVRVELILRGIDGDRMYAAGLGEDYPIADNGTEEGRRANRRVTFFVEEWAEPEPED